MRSLILLFMGGVLGFFLAVSFQSTKETSTALPLCASQVVSATWSVYTNTKWGITLQIPAGYEIQEAGNKLSIGQSSTGTSLSSLTLEKLRGDVQKYAEDSMVLASWSIHDRQLFALATPYINTGNRDQNPVRATYLLVRDFPKVMRNNVIVRAVLTDRLDNPAFRSAKMVRTTGEEGLTPLEQILSTFRFLTYEEIYGYEGFKASVTNE